MCKNAQVGCVACKNELYAKLNSILEPIRARRAYYESHKSEVKDILMSGTKKANLIGNEVVAEVKNAMGITILN